MDTTKDQGRKQAQTLEEIKPLVELCRAGRLFEVQDWIRAGQPVNPPPHAGRGNRPRSPLEAAVEQGFHSLIQVLLEAGADLGRKGYCSPMSSALKQRRFDVVKLLVEHGYDPSSIDMREVFHTWDGAMMEYFIDRGADVETGNPLAYALCCCVQTALRVLKRDRHRFPSFQRQADTALRYHCKKGNMKWVSLMLWAGADPYAHGPESYDEDSDRGGITALGLAALHRHYEVFELKQLKLDPKHPAMRQAAYFACSWEGKGLLEKLFGLGVVVNDQENGGCSLIERMLHHMSWNHRSGAWGSRPGPEGLDTSEAREGIELIKFLAQHGARWVPKDDRELNSTRRSLMKLVPKYTLDFVSIMAKHQACCRATVQSLLRTGTMKKHTANHAGRITKLVASLPEEAQTTSA